jgi:tetratricopeptide (TPR) repeat protein
MRRRVPQADDHVDLPPQVPEEARRCFERAYSAQMDGRLDEAIGLYKESIAAGPTAEAHTFLGWVYSMELRWEEAIAECRRAIGVDPEFGNPYNDIGAYLIELGRIEEAMPWLERAKGAARYEPRHYPHINLSRIHVLRNDIIAAVRELRAALGIEPGHVAARREMHRLLGMLN